MEQSLLAASLAAYKAGHYGEAATLSRSALGTSPGDEGLLTLLAMAEHAAGNHSDAADAFRQLTVQRPTVPQYWSNLGYMLRLSGAHDEAEAAFLQSLAVAPQAHDTLVNYGLLLLDMGRFGAARHRFLDAVDVDPGSASARIYASITCFECGDSVRANALIPPPHVWPALDADLRRDLAMALTHVGRASEAEALLSEDMATADPATVAQLAMLYERTNRLDRAKALLEKIRDHVDDGQGDLKLHALTVEAALAIRDRDLERAHKATTELLQLDLPPSVEANAHFTLASIADKKGEPDEAMRLLAKAHAFQLQQASEIAPEIAASSDEPLRIAMEWMTPSQCGFASDGAFALDRPAPVFIVGFPRSGTTMLEQMLDAHPGYASMDEQLILHHCIKQMEEQGFRYPHELDRLDSALVDAIRMRYWEEVAHVVQLGDDQRLVDKNPLNLLRLPMIRRIFPTAKIILALRHPCDVMLSCYMQNFRSPAFMVLCSSLQRLARSYANAMQSWIHHQRLLSPDVLVLRYEETVTDFERQTARIAGFLGIDDAARLADFAGHAARKSYISTPSYAQVTEPVNTRAVARWHAYRAYFEPVFPILQPVADHWDYRLHN